nr:copper chaperone PCu(A)C [Gammaproteobacteria bacterium]
MSSRYLLCKTFIGWLLLACLPALQAADNLRVEDAWARETPPGVSNGAAYVTLVNDAANKDWLVAAWGAVSETVELHTHLMEGDMIMMRQVERIEVDAGDRTVLEPGGKHLMLIGLKQPLVAGDRFPLTLEFEQNGEITVQFEVRRSMH